MVKRGPRGPRKTRTLNLGQYAKIDVWKGARNCRFDETVRGKGELVAIFRCRGREEALGEGNSIFLGGKKYKIDKVSRKKLDLKLI